MIDLVRQSDHLALQIRIFDVFDVHDVEHAENRIDFVGTDSEIQFSSEFCAE
jgi:hypothetical protein